MKRIITMPLNKKNNTINNTKEIDKDFYDEAYMKLLDAILTDNVNQEDMDDMFTMALIALEEYDYDAAINHSSAVSLRTDSIEQKIAAMHITSIALEKNNTLTDAFLIAIYK